MKIELQILSNIIVSCNYEIDNLVLKNHKMGLNVCFVENVSLDMSTIIFCLEMFIVNPFNFK